MTVRGMILGEELGDVEADAARADDRHPPARVLASLDDLDVACDLGMIDAGNRRNARHDAGRDDHVLIVA